MQALVEAKLQAGFAAAGDDMSQALESFWNSLKIPWRDPEESLKGWTPLIFFSFPRHPTRQKKTGASQKRDRSKNGPPEVPHREGALGDLWGTDFEGGRELLFLRGFWGTCGGVARGLAGNLWGLFLAQWKAWVAFLDFVVFSPFARNSLLFWAFYLLFREF